MPHHAEPILRASDLHKGYGVVQALDGVDFSVTPGEVRALLGKNGAGKSTLVKIVSGAEEPDAGELFLRGERVRFASPHDAQLQGIATVYQELSLVPGLTVAENIMLGRWDRRGVGPFQMIDRQAVFAGARASLEKLGERLPLHREVHTLRLAHQQIVEIAKAISFDPDVLILDEPTSALNAHEVDALIALVRRLAAAGVAVIYVSHRVQEIPRVADSITVLRDGREVGTMRVSLTSTEKIARLITGEDLLETLAVPASTNRDRPVALAVRDLRQEGLLSGVTFDVHEGEVVGLAGVLGSGRTEILEAIYGNNHEATGTVEVEGRTVRRRTPRRMLARGVGLTPEDRKRSGLVLELPITQNLVMASLGRILRFGLISTRVERRLATYQVEALSIAAGDLALQASSLSGGNQQKVVIGKLLNARTRVLLLDEPTRGVDVHAKQQIYALMRRRAEEGDAVVFVSSELDELTFVCDRVLVLNGGRIVHEFAGRDATPARLLALAITEAKA